MLINLWAIAWRRNYDNMLSRFDRIPESDGLMDGQTDGRTDKQTDGWRFGLAVTRWLRST